MVVSRANQGVISIPTHNIHIAGYLLTIILPRLMYQYFKKLEPQAE